MVPLYPEFFNDVFGPVMQPGSSSHMAGPCRLGYLAACLLGEQPRSIQFTLDPQGSFAGTFGLMNEDLGLLAGTLGLLPDDRRLFDARQIARAAGIEHRFIFQKIPESAHPNAVGISLQGKTGASVTLVGDSTGGGMIEIKAINGFPVSLKGDTHVALVFSDGPDMGEKRLAAIRAALEEIVEEAEVESQGRNLHLFKTSAPPRMEKIRRAVEGHVGLRAAVLDAVLPVLTRPNRKPQLFDSMTQWRAIAALDRASLFEVALRYEEDASTWDATRIMAYMRMIAAKMHRQAHAAYEEPVHLPEDPFRRRDDLVWPDYQGSAHPFAGATIAEAVRLAFGAAVKQPGVEIVPGPMGTGGGYIYAALSAVKEARGFTDDDLLRGLFIAAGVGAIAYTRTEPTGEVIGCTGECGVCSAMASAAITEMAGGTPEQVENAASFVIQAMMGLPCDPLLGGFDQPCTSRIISAVSMAIVFADLALSGSRAVLPFHEALDAADRVGRALPAELRCTSRGGCCATPTARRLAREFRQWRGLPRPE